jgi:hypothetical protein
MAIRFLRSKSAREISTSEAEFLLIQGHPSELYVLHHTQLFSCVPLTHFA